MIKKIERKIYGNHWLISHIFISFFSIGIIICILKICNIPLHNLFNIINDDIISLSAAIGGFLFAGMSILISMNDNKKLCTIKNFDGDKIIFHILLSSVVSFMGSICFMVIDKSLFIFDYESIESIQKIAKTSIEIMSLYLFLLGFVFMFSSLKIFRLIFK